MPPTSSVVLGLQGVFGILNGLASLLSSRAAAHNMSTLSITSLPAIHSIALGSLSIGTFYLLAVRNNDRTAMWLTVAGRAVAVGVFWGHGGPWRNVSIFEGVMGGLLGVALGWESRRGGEKVKSG